MTFHANKKINIDLNFAESSITKSYLGILLFAIGLSLFSYTTWTDYSTNQQYIKAKQALGEIASAKKQTRVKTDSEIKLDKEMSGILERTSIAWPDLFSILEQHYINSIIFTAIQFDAGTRNLNITGLSNQLANIIVLVESLKKSDKLTSVDLMNHHQIKVDGRSMHSFEIHATW